MAASGPQLMVGAESPKAVPLSVMLCVGSPAVSLREPLTTALRSSSVNVSWPVSVPPVSGEKLMVRSHISFRPMVPNPVAELLLMILGQALVAVVAQVQFGLMLGFVPLSGISVVIGSLPASVAKA